MLDIQLYKQSNSSIYLCLWVWLASKPNTFKVSYVLDSSACGSREMSDPISLSSIVCRV